MAGKKKTWLGFLADTWGITWDFIVITLPKSMQEWIKNFLKAFKVGAAWMSNLIDKVKGSVKDAGKPSKKETEKKSPVKPKEKEKAKEKPRERTEMPHGIDRTIVRRRVTRFLRDPNRKAFERT